MLRTVVFRNVSLAVLGLAAFALLLYSLFLQGIISLPQPAVPDDAVLPVSREFAAATAADEEAVRSAAVGFLATTGWVAAVLGDEPGWAFADAGAWTLDGERVGVYGDLDLDSSVWLSHPVDFTVCGRPASFVPDAPGGVLLAGFRVVVLDRGEEILHVLPLGDEWELPRRAQLRRDGHVVDGCLPPLASLE